MRSYAHNKESTTIRRLVYGTENANVSEEHTVDDRERIVLAQAPDGGAATASRRVGTCLKAHTGQVGQHEA